MSAGAASVEAATVSGLPVRRKIDAARRRWLASRLLEAALLGISAALVVLAAGLLSGASLGQASLFVLASVAAIACGATWIAERWRSLEAFAQRMDQRLGRGGALLTAFECEMRADAGPVERALVARVMAELSPDALRAAAPLPSIAFAAAPLFAAAALVFVFEQGLGPRSPLGIPELARALSAQLARTATHASASPEHAAAIAETAALVAQIGTEESALAPEAERRVLTEVELRLARLASAVEEDPLVARDIAAARALSERALQALGSAPEAAGEPAPRDGRAQDLAGTADLASGGAEATMSGSSSIDETPARTSASAASLDGVAPSIEAGTVAGRWWPERYDGVVAAWIEARRSALERNP